MEIQFSDFIVFFAFLFAFAIFTKYRIINSASKLPPGPKKLPFIGNLHLLFGKLPHHCLRDLAKIYGPIMHLQLGEISTVVISSSEIAKDIIQNHDSNFADRPSLYAAQSITYDFSDIAFARYDDQWRALRKICNLELLSQKRVQSFKSIRDDEYSTLVKAITSTPGSPIHVGDMLYSSSLSIITRAAMGKKFKHKEAFKDRISSIISLLTGFSPVDVFPSVKIFHLIHAMSPKMKKLHREVDEILESTIREHRANLGTEQTNSQDAEAEDLLSVLLYLQEKGGLKVPLTDTCIKAVILDMFVAGAETAVTTAEWAMSEMCREPRIMEKAQEEVRRVFASEAKIEEEKVHQLKYLNCVIKETFRLHPPVPMLLPRESRDKCEITGYEIPAKTRLIINAWALSRDPNHWIEPEKFYPERFLEREVVGIDYELIPFGAGKRKCPAETYGSQSTVLMLANLLYHFDWKLPDGQKPQDLDMTEIFLTVARKKNGLLLIPIPFESSERG